MGFYGKKIIASIRLIDTIKFSIFLTINTERLCSTGIFYLRLTLVYLLFVQNNECNYGDTMKMLNSFCFTLFSNFLSENNTHLPVNPENSVEDEVFYSQDY